MARRKRASAEQPIGVGLTTKQMKRKKPLSAEYLVDIEPLTENQKNLFKEYGEGKHIVAYGCAGTGKTLLLFLMHYEMFLMKELLMREFIL